MDALSHYRVLRQLGSGGMGDVYLAEDTILHRKVALKVLPEKFTSNVERLQRFQREARAISALNHPNILTIFEIGEDAGTHFIATEYIDGETLRSRIARGGIDLRQALDTAISIAAALAEAHSAGIIHRDIKPENVMLRPDGLVKVLDFGLAKRSDRDLEAALSEAPTAVHVETDPGTVVGTAWYMSPEQARGLPIDARTDLFSLGSVLYEMITGHRPFRGDTSTDVLAMILHREPDPLARYSGEIPPELQWIVDKAMAKNREERYQTAREIHADLRKLRSEVDRRSSAAGETPTLVSSTSAAAVPSQVTSQDKQLSSAEYIVSEIRKHRKSIALLLGAVLIASIVLGYFMTRSTPIDSVAVLPFVTTAGDTDSEYLADGITENIINSLSQVANLRVVPRSSVYRYKGKDVPVEQIAKDLNARAILTGRLLRRGDRMIIRTELVDIDSHAQLWGEEYDRSIPELMSVQSDIAQQISDRLRLRLTGDEQKRLDKRATRDSEAYDLYMKGRYHWNKRSPSNIEKAMQYYRQAIERDPTFALAWSGIADVYVVMPNYTSIESADAYPKAKEAARRAIELDPELAEPHAALGGVLFEYEWNAREGERELRRAIELRPDYATARQWYADLLAATGRNDEAIAMARRAVESDPLSPLMQSSLANMYLLGGKTEEAIQMAKKVLASEPDFPNPMFVLLNAHNRRGEIEPMLAVARRLEELIDDPMPMAMALARAGRREEALAKVRQFEEKGPPKGNEIHSLALTYGYLGLNDRAFALLEEAFTKRAGFLAYLRADPQADPLRSDPRFEQLVSRIGI